MNEITFGSKPLTNDEINLRINMIDDMLKRLSSTDDMNILNLQREKATWVELVRRRKLQ